MVNILVEIFTTFYLCIDMQKHLIFKILFNKAISNILVFFSRRPKCFQNNWKNFWVILVRIF